MYLLKSNSIIKLSFSFSFIIKFAFISLFFFQELRTSRLLK